MVSVCGGEPLVHIPDIDKIVQGILDL